MSYENDRARRIELNNLMSSTDDFYKLFGALDDAVYSDGLIPTKYKELMGLAISVTTRCNECITYHIGGCVDNGATKEEILEALKIGVVAGGSITYPNVRHAFSVLQELALV